MWSVERIATELRYHLSTLPAPPYKAAAFRMETPDEIDLRVYFDPVSPPTDGDIEEVTIILTEFYSGTSSNSDVGLIKFDFAAFDEDRLRSDVDEGFLLLARLPATPPDGLPCAPAP